MAASDKLRGWPVLFACWWARKLELGSVGELGLLKTGFVAEEGELSRSSMLRIGGGGGLSTSSMLRTGAISSMLRTGERGDPV